MGKWGAALFKWLTDNLPAWLRQVGAWVAGLTSSFATGIQAGLPNIQTQIGNIWTALDNQFALADKLASAKNWGTVLFNNLRDGIAASDGTVLGAATAIWNVLRDMFGIDSKLRNFKTWGTNLITNLAEGILAVQHIVIHNASLIWASIKAEIEKLNLHDVGQNIIQGLANGIVGKLNELMAVGGSIQVIFSNLLAFIRGFFQEASPSKVMMRLGKNVMLGMEIGMLENTPDVIRAARQMAAGVMDATSGLSLDPQMSFSSFGSLPSTSLPSIGTLSNQDMMRPNVTTNNMTYNLSYETMRSAESIQQDIELLNLLYGGGRSA